MPAKLVKTGSGRIVEVKSIRLKNGNLLVPRRNRETNRADWVEVSPGDPDYKRWLPVAVDEADPR
jgi:hypothetical protein